MRILHVLDHSVPHNTEYAARAQAVVRGTEALGLEVVQLTGPHHAVSDVRDESIDGRTYYRTPPVASPLSDVAVLGEFEFIGEIAHRVEQIARRTRPHVLHVHSPVQCALGVLRVGRRLGLPVILDLHGLWREEVDSFEHAGGSYMRGRILHAMEAFTARRAAHLVTSSTSMRERFIARGLPCERVTAITNGADVRDATAAAWVDARREELGFTGRRVVGFAGRLLECEGVGLLLDAFDRVHRALPDAVLLVVGSGPARDGIVRRIEALGNPSPIRLVECQTIEEERAWLDVMDVAVYPRQPVPLASDEVPYRVCMGFAAGAAMLISDVGGHKAALATGTEAQLFRAGDAEDLAAGLLRLLNSSRAREFLRSAARTLAQETLDWTSRVASYSRIYESLQVLAVQSA